LTIKSKIHKYGDENESEWPPQFPRKQTRGIFYWDRETKSLKPGHPPNPNNRFGEAPTVIFDSMPKTYHEGAQQWVESRSEWNQLDEQTGSITFGSVAEPRKYVEKGTKEERAALRADRRRASLEAIQKVRANPTEIRQKLDKEAAKQEKLAKKAGIDLQAEVISKVK